MIIGGNEEKKETELTEDEGRGGIFPVFSHAYLVLILFKLPAGNKLFHIGNIH